MSGKKQSKNSQEDFELVQQAKDDSAVAYNKLMAKYHKSVYYMLLKMVSNPNDAEDLAQEAFAKAFASLDKFDPKYAFSTWLFRIATNNCIDFIRKKRIQTISIDNSYKNDDGDSFSFDVKDTNLTPNEAMLKKQRKEYLKKAVAQLPAKYKVLVELRYFKEMSYDEVAKELELPLGTVKAQLFRARELLTKALGHLQDQM